MSAIIRITNQKARIFVVDDHPIIRKGIIQLVNQEDDMVSVGEAGNPLEAIGGIAQTQPDLVTMDISLGDSNGIELTECILSKNPKMMILMLSMHDESVYAERILKIGARGYLQKRETVKFHISHKVLLCK